MLMELDDTCANMARVDKLDMRAAMLPLLRGMVDEELAEVFAVKAKEFARLAHDELAQVHMFSTTETKRLERKRQLKNLDQLDKQSEGYT